MRFATPTPTPRKPAIAARMAKAMIERTRNTGACTFTDLRRAGFSRDQILAHIDDARELIGASASDLLAA